MDPPDDLLLHDDLAEMVSWLGDERERFYDVLDALPLGEAHELAADAVDEWSRLSAAVGRPPAQLHELAAREYERLALDPELLELQRRGVAWAEGAEAAAEGGGGGGKKRERGQAWSEEEHKRFLVGLERFGKGDWRSIARQCVLTRTPAQVASHAQKYFLRQDGRSDGRCARRASIHDISSLDDTLPPRAHRKRAKPAEPAEPAAQPPPPAVAAGGGGGRGAGGAAGLRPAATRPAVSAAAARAQPSLHWAPVQQLPSGPKKR